MATISATVKLCPAQEVAFTALQHVLGRDQATVLLPVADKSISRPHARVQHRDGVFVIESLKLAENPAYLNDKPVLELQALTDGDSLRLGSVTFQFRTVL